jgi:hypothetical protein
MGYYICGKGLGLGTDTRDDRDCTWIAIVCCRICLSGEPVTEPQVERHFVRFVKRRCIIELLDLPSGVCKSLARLQHGGCYLFIDLRSTRPKTQRGMKWNGRTFQWCRYPPRITGIRSRHCHKSDAQIFHCAGDWAGNGNQRKTDTALR